MDNGGKGRGVLGMKNSMYLGKVGMWNNEVYLGSCGSWGVDGSLE